MPTNLSKQQEEELKDIVVKYLQGQSLRTTKIRLSEVSEGHEKSGRELYKAMAVTLDNADDKFIVAILGSLNIKKSPTELGRPVQGEFEKLIAKSKDVHELLTNLYHNGHHHVGYLLTLIENTKPRRNWAGIFLLGTILSGAIGTFGYFKREYINTAIAWATETFPNVITWLGRTFSMLRNLPLLGIIQNALALLWFWYNTFTNGTAPTRYKLENLFFKTLAVGLTIGAYCLTYAAEGILTFPAACLFVLGTSIDFFKALYNFYQTQDELQNLIPTSDEEQSWEQIAELERVKNLRYRTVKSIYVKLAAAVLTTIAVGIWNFFPPNLIITISCITVMSLISLTKRAWLSNIYENYAERLQKSIHGIQAFPSPELAPASSHSIHRLKEKERQLDVRERAVEQREKDLEQLAAEIATRKQAVEDTLLAVAKGRELSSTALVLKGLGPNMHHSIPVALNDSEIPQSFTDGLPAEQQLLSLSAPTLLLASSISSGEQSRIDQQHATFPQIQQDMSDMRFSPS